MINSFFFNNKLCKEKQNDQYYSPVWCLKDSMYLLINADVSTTELLKESLDFFSLTFLLLGGSFATDSHVGASSFLITLISAKISGCDFHHFHQARMPTFNMIGVWDVEVEIGSSIVGTGTAHWSMYMYCQSTWQSCQPEESDKPLAVLLAKLG